MTSPERTCVMQAPFGVGLFGVSGEMPAERMQGDVVCVASLRDILPISVRFCVALKASCSSPPLTR